MTRLRDYLSSTQQQALADEISSVMVSGYGQVTIEIRGGKVRFIKSERSRDLNNGTLAQSSNNSHNA
jgi:hypothetical protein